MAAEVQTLAKADRVALGGTAVEVTLDAIGSAEGGLASVLAALPPERRIYLVLDNARAAEPPEALYRIYVTGRPGGGPPGPTAAAVGSVNFFNAEPARPRAYSFDVTDEVRALLRRGAVGRSLTITIVPAGPPNPAARPVVGRVALVAQ